MSEHKCPACGGPVLIETGGEGTSYMVPVVGYTKDQIIEAANQELDQWKGEGSKARTANDYRYLGFLNTVLNRLNKKQTV